MKTFCIALFFFLTFSSFAHNGQRVIGKLMGQGPCAQGKAVLWVSQQSPGQQKEEYLYETQLPVGGTYEFYLLPGKYQLSAYSDQSCEHKASIEIKEEGRTFNMELRAMK